ncbi:hypothetical protein M433DRAFT_493451 [Acidomyces richmondensis BFW]|nr:MAG: hypothetical protein FE78DRAFT_307356 [Acidomyces sp. 'richmondensis']KYG41199.1 hypothetical protein M433DRAFT_493451 [Acidomyces richmondensis BFW]
MNASIRDSYALSESNIQEAIAAFQAKRCQSIRATARAFSVPLSTLHSRMAGSAPRRNAHESEQLLSNAEEKTLLRWITRLTRTVYPASPALGLEMAETIRRQRLQLSKQAPR